MWNMQSEKYKDRDRKPAAVEKTTEYTWKSGVYLSTRDVKKIDTLQNQHQQEMRHVQKSMKSGTGTTDIYNPSL